MTSLCALLCATRSWWNSWWKCRRSYPFLPCGGLSEQHVDIPVPRRCGRSSDLQGFLPGQSSTALSSSSKKRISERTVEHIVRFPGEGLQDFRPGQVSPASSSFHSPAGSDDDANEPGDGVFRTFPHGKKVRSAGQVSADLPRHISSWTTAAYEQSRGSHEQEVEMEKKKAEYERRMIVINQRVADGLPIDPKEYEAWRRWSGLPPSSSYSSGKRRKRKKRSKKKLSKSSSGVRIRRCVHRFRSRSSSSRCVPALRPLVSGSLLFAVLLVSTVDTCYVSLQRFLWLHSTTLRSSLQSSIFAWAVWHVVNYAVLGTDSQAIRGLYASVQFSDKVVFLPGVGQRLALMVQTVLKPGQFSVMDVDMPAAGQLLAHMVRQCSHPWSSHRCNSWDVDMPAAGQRLALMVQTVQMPV